MQKCPKDKWKLIAYPKLQKYKLFDLANDPQEAKDLASAPEHADVLSVLKVALEKKMDELDDPMTSILAADFSEKKGKKK